MTTHEETVRSLAADIQFTQAMRAELACLAAHLQEPPAEVFAEALSELRSARDAVCDDPACCPGFTTRLN